MPRTYTLTDARPHPANPLNLSTVIRVDDSDTGESITLTDRIFASDLDDAQLKVQLGLIEQNVMVPRAIAKAKLTALIGLDIEPTLPTAIDPLQLALEVALATLAKLKFQVDTGVLKDTEAEYTDAVAAAKAAKAALEAKPK